jgi:hypothetical protein
MRQWVRDHALGLLFAGLFLVTWAGQWIVEVPLAANSPDAPPLLQWAAHTLENWQSEFLQLASFVIFSAYLIYRGSPESKDDSERTQRTLNRIEARLEALERRL